RITINEAVVLDGSAVVEDRGVMDLPDGQLGDVVRGDVVDEVDRLRTGDDELAHVRDVEQPAPLTHRLVLRRYASGILDRHLVPCEGHDLRAEGAMDVVEWRALERGRCLCHRMIPR